MLASIIVIATINHYLLHHMMYADDIQLYITCDDNQVLPGIIVKSVGEVRHWKRTNTLALNDSKTKVIHLCTKCCGQEHVPQCGLHVGGIRISPIYAACNLRIIMDSAGTIPTHVSKLCKSALFALWKIGGIRTLLDQSTTLKLIHAFVTSRMHYYISLLLGLRNHETRKTQIIRNSVAHLVTKTKYNPNITGTLLASGTSAH